VTNITRSFAGAHDECCGGEQEGSSRVYGRRIGIRTLEKIEFDEILQTSTIVQSFHREATRIARS